MAELIKAPWSDWETVRMIGRGSFGTVYEIQRKLVDEDTESAALKVITIPQNPGDVEELYSEGYDDESITATFNSHLKSIVAEYSLMRKMDGSANIVNCKDIRYIQHDDGIGWDIFIRMELLTPLMKALPADTAEQTIIKIGKDICNALVLCKKHEIIHRDIKPQNIFVSPNGDYKLGDFGIAKTVEKTMGGTKIGTYKYMAPEVYNNQPYGSAADIYSLGLVLYWLLNERRMPFMPLPPAKLGAEMDEEARHRRLSGERLPAPAHGSDELKQIVLKACAYDPKDRYTSAATMLDDLNKLTGGVEPITPVIIPEEEAEEAKTTGPLFGKNNISKIDTARADDSDKTVGPSFVVTTPPVEKSEKEEPTPTSFGNKGEREKSSALKYVLIALGIVIVIALFFLLRSCDVNKPSDDPSQETTNTQSTEGGTEGSTEGSTAATEQLVWSDWLDNLPEGITADKYDIEEKTLYSSRTQETTSSTEKNTMDGWELYNTVEANGEFGPWSDWSASKVDSSANREVDTQTRYRYRDKETTSSKSSTMDGWTCYASEDNYIYGEWSSWMAGEDYWSSHNAEIEITNGYSYWVVTYQGDEAISGGYTKVVFGEPEHAEGYTWNDGTYTYKITQVMKAVYSRARSKTYDSTTYYFYRWGNWSNWSTDKVSSSGDRQVENTTFYRYRDRAKDITYYFRRWTDWSAYSENEVTSSDSVEVQTKVQYRYKSKAN